jgi:putative polyketide hydroxylase
MGRLARQTGTTIARPEFLNEQGLIFGASYASAAVIPDGTPSPPVANPVTDYIPAARPGSRAPHVWLARQGERLSTIDLFWPRFVLLAGRNGDSWRKAADAVARPAIDAFTVGGAGELSDADADGSWQHAYDVGDEGAVLVRPDGYVAWRSRGAAPDHAATLQAAIDRILGHATTPPR